MYYTPSQWQDTAVERNDQRSVDLDAALKGVENTLKLMLAQAQGLRESISDVTDWGENDMLDRATAHGRGDFIARGLLDDVLRHERELHELVTKAVSLANRYEVTDFEGWRKEAKS